MRLRNQQTAPPPSTEEQTNHQMPRHTIRSASPEYISANVERSLRASTRSPSSKRKAANLDFSSGLPKKRKQSQPSQSTSSGKPRELPPTSLSIPGAKPGPSARSELIKARTLLQDLESAPQPGESPVRTATSSPERTTLTSQTSQPESEPSYNFVQLPTPSLITPAAEVNAATGSFLDDFVSIESLVTSCRRSSQKIHDHVLQDEDVGVKARTLRKDMARDIADYEAKIETIRQEMQIVDDVIQTRCNEFEAMKEQCSEDVKAFVEALRT